MGEQGFGVEVDRVAAYGLDDGDARGVERIAEVRRRTNAITQVVGADRFAKALGQRLEVASGQSAISGEALGENQHIATGLGQGRRR